MQQLLSAGVLLYIRLLVVFMPRQRHAHKGKEQALGHPHVHVRTRSLLVPAAHYHLL